MKQDIPERREYLEERYRHLLSTIYGLGALRAALITALIVNFLIIAFTYNQGELLKLFLIPALIFATNGYLLFIADKGFKYYSTNLNHFQGYFLDSYFKSKKEKVNQPEQESDTQPNPNE